CYTIQGREAMLDINVIREKPEWVKEQLAKLQDPDAVNRVDDIVKLDQQRRTLLTETEAIQANRNKLNKNVGRLRGDKKLDETTRNQLALQAVQAIEAGNYDAAAGILDGKPGDHVNQDTTGALDKLTDALRAMGDKVNTMNAQISDVEAQLQEHML